MYVFAEPVEEAEIEEINRAAFQRQADYEKSLFGQDTDPEQSVNADDWAKIQASVESELESQPNGAVIEEAEEKQRPEDDVDSVESIEIAAEDVDPETARSKGRRAPTDAKTGADLSPLLGFTLTVRNVVNGRPVTRPKNLSADDTWRVEYHIAEMKPEAAHRHYRLLKQRRAKAAEEPPTDRLEQSLYFRRIREHVAQSREWRSKQDELDRDRKPVVFQPWQFKGQAAA